MDQSQNPVPSAPNHKMSAQLVGILIAGVIIGLIAGYLVMKQSINKLEKQVAELQTELKKPKTTNSNQTPTSTEQTPKPYNITLYRTSFTVPGELDSNHSNEVSIPLGSTGSYTVKSTLETFDDNSNLRILAATDSVVYENFIRNGTQAITPDPNTLTPGNPNSIKGVNFCTLLAAKSCTYDEKTDTAIFVKDYNYSQNNPYTVWGAAKFFSVSESNIGKQAAIMIVRISANDQKLIDMAKEIILSAKKY